jgi:DNA polymerase III epsilon subunit-like protein
MASKPASAIASRTDIVFMVPRGSDIPLPTYRPRGPRALRAAPRRARMRRMTAPASAPAPGATPRPPRPLRYFCIDVESSGAVPGLFNLLSIGCVAIDPGPPLRPADELYVELRPTFAGFDPGAMAVNGLDRAALERDGLDPAEALRRLTAFVDARRPEDGRAIFVGHNAPFDWAMVNFYYHHFGLKNPFGYSALDTKALAMGALALPWPDTNKETLERLLVLPPQDASQIHRADYDARYQALIFCKLMERIFP